MTASPTNTAREWFHASEGRTCGPTSLGDLVGFLRSREIQPGSLVWCQGMTAWQTPAEAIAAGPPAPPDQGGPATPWLPPPLPASVASQRPHGRDPASTADRLDASTGRARPNSYVAAHWRGDLSLARSFWLNHILIAGLAVFALLAATGQIDRGLGERPALVLALTLPILVLLLLVQGWQIAGTWRSARRRAFLRGHDVLRRFVQTLLVIDMAGTAIIVLGASVNHVQAALSGLPVAVAGAIVRDEGRRIDLSGPLTPASPEIFRHALALAPGVRLARLSSDGGSVPAARQIATVIRDAGLDTEVAQTCASACTIVFFGGHHRILRDGARLGFHSYSSPTMTPQAIVADEEVERKTYQAAGLPADFIERIFSVPPSRVWYPQRDEAIAAGFATAETTSAVPHGDNLRSTVQQGTAAYLAGDYAAALRLFRIAAGTGDATAEYDLGLLYSLGLGVTQDEAAAAAWFSKAAADGQPTAKAVASGLPPGRQVAAASPVLAPPVPVTGPHLSEATARHAAPNGRSR